MVRVAAFVLSASLLLASAAVAQTAATGLRREPTPVVVELFTAQGCPECAAANAWATRMGGREGMIVLTYPVDVWDYLGWKDTMARPAHTERQKAYKERLGLKDVYTPQAVIDGRIEVAAVEPRRLMRRVGEAPDIAGPGVTFDRGGVRVYVGAGPSPAGGAEVWMVRYDPRILAVKVTAGENEGANVTYRNVVRELVRLGPYTGRGRAYALPRPSHDGLRTVVMVQSLRRVGMLAAGRAGDRVVGQSTLSARSALAAEATAAEPARKSGPARTRGE